ncbi:hypothetical protein EDB89DRAFT_348034 [Lactarius sanguifluus]|nr:hypothetical protein EDB89DRAFT_348034 [Lactarius sanguifluus]
MQLDHLIKEATPQETIAVVCRATRGTLNLRGNIFEGSGPGLRELETSSDIGASSFGTPALRPPTLGTSIVLSILNCGNQAPRLFGFGPFSGYGLGYIVKDDELSVCVSSKRTFLAVCDTFAVASGLRPCSVAPWSPLQCPGFMSSHLNISCIYNTKNFPGPQISAWLRAVPCLHSRECRTRARP